MINFLSKDVISYMLIRVVNYHHHGMGNVHLIH